MRQQFQEQIIGSLRQQSENIETATKNLIKQRNIIEGNSNHHTRVFYKKYMNQVNQALQSLITAGRLKRMQLISINNRALFNKGKVQRSQWVSKKHTKSNQGFLPDIKSLVLDTRSPERASKHKKRYQTEVNEETQQHVLQTTAYIDKFIQQQINRIKRQRLLDLGRTQQQLVLESIKIIQDKIMQKNLKNKSMFPLLPNQKTNRLQYKTKQRQHRRSVFQSVYCQKIQQIQKKQQAINKLRSAQRKQFLRRIKYLKKES